MSGGVFVLKGDRTLIEMQQASFASEDDFQQLLADFPALLAGSQIDAAVPRRWVLVTREKSVAAEESGSARWSVDHLFLDQDGIPTLVELKRQNDTRIRREVVGQMLEYAANGAAWWSIDEIRASFTATCVKAGADPDGAVAGLIGADADAESFWLAVSTNLKNGRIRMLFVADVIPPELRRIVEFLNKQMNPAEVLAVELRQFEGQGMRTIVPLVFGQTEQARAQKAGPRDRRVWDASTFYSELRRRQGAAAVSVAQRFEQWMRTNATEVWFGTGTQTGSMGSAVFVNGRKFVPLTIYTTGRAETLFDTNQKPPFDDPHLMREWKERMSQATGIAVAENATQITMKQDVLMRPGCLDAVLDALSWASARMQNSLVQNGNVSSAPSDAPQLASAS